VKKKGKGKISDWRGKGKTLKKEERHPKNESSASKEEKSQFLPPHPHK